MPFISEAQRRLMYAAAAGKKTKADISQTAAKKLVAEDEPGKLPEKVSKAEDDGSDMAKQLLASINEMSAKLNEMIDSGEELEDWVDSKIASAKKDLEDISSYIKYNEDAQKSIHGSENTPAKTVVTVDGMAKADDLGDYEKKAQGALDFKNQMKQFRREHGSTIMDIAGGRKVDKARADAYHTARGNLMIGEGVSHTDIPPKIPASLIHHSVTPTVEEVKPLALPAAKSMEALVRPKSLLAKVDGCMKCMRKSSEEELEKSSKKKSKPFHGYNKKKHARSGGLNDAYRKKLNRETGSNLKRPVTKKNVKPGSKAAKRRKSFCARMSGVKGPTSKDGKLTPKGAALKRWRCSKSLNKSESVPLELRAQKVLKSLDTLIKSNSIRPFNENIYDSVANIGRKMSRTGEEMPDIGGNKAVHQYGNTAWGTSKEQAQRQAKRDQEMNRRNPVTTLDLTEVPSTERQNVISAYQSKQFHPLLSRAIKILNKRKQETEKSLEKKFSLKGALTAGALGASALAGVAHASPESDLHSQLSNLNVMGEYHTPKTGSKAVLKEPSQLKADSSHPSSSYSKESTSGSSMGNFYGPDAERAKQILQNYDSVNKSFKKSDKIKGGKGDDKNISDFDPLEVEQGKKVEMEHTSDPSVAQEITKDHLTEDRNYYSKLKTSGLADELKKRCWEGYKPVPGKKAYSKGSCEPIEKAISAEAMERGQYHGEKLDANHHNRLGGEYKELARKALKTGDKVKASSMMDKSKYHYNMADKKGYTPPND